MSIKMISVKNRRKTSYNFKSRIKLGFRKVQNLSREVIGFGSMFALFDL